MTKVNVSVLWAHHNKNMFSTHHTLVVGTRVYNSYLMTDVVILFFLFSYLSFTFPPSSVETRENIIQRGREKEQKLTPSVDGNTVKCLRGIIHGNGMFKQGSKVSRFMLHAAFPLLYYGFQSSPCCWLPLSFLSPSLPKGPFQREPSNANSWWIPNPKLKSTDKQTKRNVKRTDRERVYEQVCSARKVPTRLSLVGRPMSCFPLFSEMASFDPQYCFRPTSRSLHWTENYYSEGWHFILPYTFHILKLPRGKEGEKGNKTNSICDRTLQIGWEARWWGWTLKSKQMNHSCV